MREEVWRNMLLATLNAKYSRARAQVDDRFLRSAQEWEHLAHDWLRQWSKMQDDGAYVPPESEMDSLRSRTSAAKGIPAPLPEDIELTERCWEETLILRGVA